jgi:hypothetical protein
VGDRIAQTVVALSLESRTEAISHDDSYGYTVVGANVGATRESGEPHHCGDPFSTASVWYRWTLSSAATVRVQAAGSRFLCVMAYRSAGGPAPAPAFVQLAPVGGQSDDQGFPIDFSFTAAPGSTYWFAVNGVSVEYACNPTTGQCLYTTPTGTFTFTVTA